MSKRRSCQNRPKTCLDINQKKSTKTAIDKTHIGKKYPRKSVPYIKPIAGMATC